MSYWTRILFISAVLAINFFLLFSIVGCKESKPVSVAQCGAMQFQGELLNIGFSYYHMKVTGPDGREVEVRLPISNCILVGE